MRTVCRFVLDDAGVWTQAAPPPLPSRFPGEAIPEALRRPPGRRGRALLEAELRRGNPDADANVGVPVVVDSPGGGKLLQVPGLSLRWDSVTAVLDRIAQELDDGGTATVSVAALRRYVGK